MHNKSHYPILDITEEMVNIIKEIKETKISERGATRMDDTLSEAAMEDRKKGGYF
jgi:sulfate adenylyltransferase subunit 2